MVKQKPVIAVNGVEVALERVNREDYISLTDMANWDNDPNAKTRIRNWLKNRSTIDFLGVWERYNNPNFNYAQLDVIRMEISTNAYVLSPKKWIEETGAVGIRSKAGRYGGTYAHSYIAFEFASWLNPEFKFYLITEFNRLKQEELSRQNREWNYGRFLSKVNYRLHTDTIRDHILPRLQVPKNKEWIAFAEEADLLNMAVFGQTAKQWREANPKAAKQGNIRDFASIAELNVLANLEGLNAYLIRKGAGKEGRYIALAEEAINQYKRLASYEGIQYLEE